ncbi:hypothetical protein NM208_g5386 [Fusarium decemcellulare]|uniref:Uncharacterized protein n=1 Tax=Fusarium decemcellulare TaxID=57161 RepID=A0ACC1SHH5_9HYPO|nr:hypothetical protein NM208_g5386 [Fusarium decemcellulare]
MCDALIKISNDKWNTRAWTLQEAFTSGGNMVLLFPRAKEICVDGWLLICQESSRSELAICLDAIQNCFELSKPLVRSLLLKDLDDAKSEFPSGKDAQFSWAHSLTRNTELLQATKWNPFGQLPLDDMSGIVTLSQHGLSTTGLVWEKSHFIELKQLQIKHADAWKNLREKELANSILNSTSSWNWNSEPRSSTIVESVDQLPSDLRVENRADLFALDPSPDGRYHQTWVIDRVMDQAGFHSDMIRIGSIMSSLAGAVVGKNAQGGSESGHEQQTSPSFMEVSGAAALIALMLAKTTSMVLESTPRSPLRGMSISWLTEPVESTDETLEKNTAVKYDTFRAKAIFHALINIMTFRNLNKTWRDVIFRSYAQDYEADAPFPVMYLINVPEWKTDILIEIPKEIDTMTFRRAIRDFVVARRFQDPLFSNEHISGRPRKSLLKYIIGSSNSKEENQLDEAALDDLVEK